MLIWFVLFAFDIELQADSVSVYLARVQQNLQHLPRHWETCPTGTPWVRNRSLLQGNAIMLLYCIYACWTADSTILGNTRLILSLDLNDIRELTEYR